MGDRQRAAAVVGMVTAVLFLVSPASMGLPAVAQITLPPTTGGEPSTTVEVPTSTTAADTSATTTADSATSTSVRRSGSTTTIERRSGSPASPSATTSARRASTSTTGASPATTATVDESPTTTEGGGFGPPVSRPAPTTTTSNLAIEQAASATGLSAGSMVTLVIAGLLAVALALSALTVRYVRATRPGEGFVE